VAADEEAGEDAVDDGLVSDDDLGDFGLDGVVILAESFAGGLDLGIDAGDGGG
jgi:hypothetical protein